MADGLPASPLDAPAAGPGVRGAADEGRVPHPPASNSATSPSRRLPATPPPRARPPADAHAPPSTSMRANSDPDPPSPTRSASPEPLATPTLAQSYGHLRKNLSFKSLRDLEVRELGEHIYRRGARTDNLKYRPKNDDEVFTHALKGGLRQPAAPSSSSPFLGRTLLTRKLPLPFFCRLSRPRLLTPSCRQLCHRLAPAHPEAVRPPFLPSTSHA